MKISEKQPNIPLCLSDNKVSVYSKADTCKIGIVADVHVRDGNRSQLLNWAQLRPQLEKFLDNMEEWKADFNIELGDFIDGHNIDPDKGDGYKERIMKGKAVWETSMAAWRKHKIPFYCVMGNHEVQNGRDNIAMAELKGMPGNYYSFDKKGYHFIVLDTDYSGKISRTSFIIPEEQLKWLKKDLAASDKKIIDIIA